MLRRAPQTFDQYDVALHHMVKLWLGKVPLASTATGENCQVDGLAGVHL